MTAIYVIAEAGVNHNGSVSLAHSLVDAAADAGADAVKFQTFDPTALVTVNAKRAPYQARNLNGSGSQLEMLKSLVLPRSAHFELLQHCDERGIDFLSTPFDDGSADFLIEDLGLDTVKVGSGDITNGPMLYRIAKAGARVILSTGMADLDEIEEALGVLVHGYEVGVPPTSRADLASAWREHGNHGLVHDRVVLLHCTTEYPCPPESVNLRAMTTISDEFQLPVGYSDHTQGAVVAVAACARGATVLEKHITMDRSMVGPDHLASIEPGELSELIAAVRLVETALGRSEKRLLEAEEANAAVARRSIVAARAVLSGSVLREDDLASKRPAEGLSPMEYWDLLGSRAARDLARDEPIGASDVLHG